MLKQDYILRMIEQVGRAVARLMSRARTENPAVVRQELDEALKDLTGLSFDVLDSLPLSAVLTILDSRSDPDPARILAIAECSFVRARLADAENRAELAFDAKVTALTLYLEALTLFRHEAVADAERRVEGLISEFHDVDLPGETIVRLFRFRSATGRFADAENSLFELFENRPADKRLIEEGRTFYRHLLSLKDDELQAGNLPRSEVLEGLAELERFSAHEPGVGEVAAGNDGPCQGTNQP